MIYINMGGVFGNEHGTIAKAKNKLSVRFRALDGLGKVLDLIEIISEWLADTAGYIAEITAVTAGLENAVVTKGGIAILTGDAIKIGEVKSTRKTGVFFIVPGTPTVSIAVMGKLAVNDPSEIIFTAPELTGAKTGMSRYVRTSPATPQIRSKRCGRYEASSRRTKPDGWLDRRVWPGTECRYRTIASDMIGLMVMVMRMRKRLVIEEYLYERVWYEEKVLGNFSR